MFAFKNGTHHENVIVQIIINTGCRKYLELGIYDGLNISKIAPHVEKAVGVDIYDKRLYHNFEFIQSTTDDFFYCLNNYLIQAKKKSNPTTAEELVKNINDPRMLTEEEKYILAYILFFLFHEIYTECLQELYYSKYSINKQLYKIIPEDYALLTKYNNRMERLNRFYKFFEYEENPECIRKTFEGPWEKGITDEEKKFSKNPERKEVELKRLKERDELTIIELGNHIFRDNKVLVHILEIEDNDYVNKGYIENIKGDKLIKAKFEGYHSIMYNNKPHYKYYYDNRIVYKNII